MPIQAKSEEKFFTKLLDETLKGVEEGHKNSASIINSELKEKKSIERIYKILEKEDIQCLQLRLIEELSCFRLSIENKVLDFPHNWSLFKELFKSIKSNKDFCYWIDKTEDDDLILKVLGQWIGEDLDAILILSNPGPFLALVSNVNKSKFEWIKKRAF